ncbi:MAG: hypothetical protein ABR527_02320 [Gemmatimonadota bacterium]
MGFLQKLILGRWFTRWLLRGGPWSIAAKLAAVALLGAWKWRKEKREAERLARSREIEATYEVLDREAGRLGSPKSTS